MNAPGILFSIFAITLMCFVWTKGDVIHGWATAPVVKSRPFCPEGQVLFRRDRFYPDICVPGSMPEYRMSP